MRSSAPDRDAAIRFSNVPTGVLPVGSEIGAFGRTVSTSATVSAAIALISSAFFTTISVGSCAIPKPSSIQTRHSSAGDNTSAMPRTRVIQYPSQLSLLSKAMNRSLPEHEPGTEGTTDHDDQGQHRNRPRTDR